MEKITKVAMPWSEKMETTGGTRVNTKSTQLLKKDKITSASKGIISEPCFEASPCLLR